MRPSLVLAFVISFFFTVGASAESHTIKFVNQCGYGTPALVLNGNNVLSGDQYTSSGPFSGIAMPTGYCNTNGENCTLVEMTLINPTCAGCGSSADISLIAPHAYSVESSFSYYSGCDGVGQTCASPNCTQNAFFVPTDNFVQKECQATDVSD
ncbi:glycopeptide [Pisolithus orientalis]|uniref:glycopeptide n=1 Tax=Pisolithus orientalis TaxID=936130 RepID=UPI002223FE29|nr:glycopeptide [Pisolithus orientalis]KAI5997811.1 glycopeptide [Pisolithus orientalis]